MRIQVKLNQSCKVIITVACIEYLLNKCHLQLVVVVVVIILWTSVSSTVRRRSVLLARSMLLEL